MPPDVRKVFDFPTFSIQSWGTPRYRLTKYKGVAQFITIAAEGHRPSAHQAAQPRVLK